MTMVADQLLIHQRGPTAATATPSLKGAVYIVRNKASRYPYEGGDSEVRFIVTAN
jgi:hypothetical protein